jgi:glycosyltransferase involved in cell wall biosynthesis
MNPEPNCCLRIVQVLPSFGVGGAENMAAHLMAGLSADHEVTAVALYSGSPSPIEERLRLARVNIRRLGKRRGLDLRMFPALDRVIRETSPHVVHTHLSVLRYVFPVLARRRVPLAVHTLHNTAERESDGAGRLIQRIAFRRTVVPVAISQEGASSFKRVYRRECAAIIANCIPIGDFQRSEEAGKSWREQRGLPVEAIVFCCVGRLEPQKNPLGLLAAFAMLNDSRTHLILLGDGELRTSMADAIRSMNLERRVHLLGKRNDIPECLAASDAFVLASNWEGSPLAVMEAMAAGLPVVSTGVGGIPELIDHQREGVLVGPGDIAGLMRAMRSLTVDPLRRRALGAAARLRARNEFGVDSMTRNYAMLYRSLLGAAPRASNRQPDWSASYARSARAAGSDPL